MTIYKPLPTDTSIRVLNVERRLPSSSTSAKSLPINYQVSFIDLDDDTIPPYTCLSYTWGSPFPPACPESLRYEFNPASTTSRPTILVDGVEMAVTQSLYEILHHLQQTEMSVPLDSFWIDATCIDQRNPEGTAERGKQVAMMDRVYATAEHVLVWLGPSNDDEADAIVQALRNLAGVSTNTYELATMDGHLNILEAPTYQKLGIPVITRNVWRQLHGFFERTWFQRMWVTQEAALARSLSFHLGSRSLTWKELDRATLLIYRLDKFFTDIYSAPAGIVERMQEPDNDLRKTELTSLAWTSIRSILSFQEEEKTLGVNRRFARRNRGIDEPVFATREYAGNAQTWKGFRTHVLHKNRRKKASDPRDKIYAMLGLIQGMTDDQGNKIINPDYSGENTPRDLYTDVLRRLFRDDSRLVWGAPIRVPPVEDRSLRNIADLPSWVPDLSAPDLPLHIMSAAFFHFNASNHLVGGFIKSNDRFKWGLLGLLVDRVVDIGEGYEEIKTTSSLRRCLNIVARLNEGILGGLERGEVLARTLIGSISLGPYIDMAEVRKIFRSYLASLKATEIFRKTAASETPSEDHIIKELQEYLVLEADWRPPATLVFEMLQQLHGHEQTGTGSDSLKAMINLASQYESKLDRIFSYRRLFLTQGGRLGIGARSIRVGDDIWIIPPEKTFHILRHTADMEFELIGDAYVDGLMFGETMRFVKESDLYGIYLV